MNVSHCVKLWTQGKTSPETGPFRIVIPDRLAETIAERRPKEIRTTHPPLNLLFTMLARGDRTSRMRHNAVRRRIALLLDQSTHTRKTHVSIGLAATAIQKCRCISAIKNEVLHHGGRRSYCICVVRLLITRCTLDLTDGKSETAG